VAPGAAEDIEKTQQLIAEIERKIAKGAAGDK
jgi:hypothetical protein